MEEKQNVHDKLFKSVFSSPAEAESFFRQYLPEKIVQKIRWETLAPMDKKYVEEIFVETESDLLFRVLLDTGQAAYLYILFEHQSTPNKWMPFKLLKYDCRILDLSFKLHPKQEKLPPVIPVVLYQGEKSWEHSVQLLDLFHEAETFGEYLPRLAFKLLDQSQFGEQEFKGTLIARIAQLLLWAAYHGDVRRVLQLLGPLLAMIPESGGLNFLRLFLLYFLQTHDNISLEEIKKGMGATATAKAEKPFISIADQLKLEGKLEGRQEGKLEGKLETAQNLIANGASLELVLKSTGLSMEQLKEAKILT